MKNRVLFFISILTICSTDLVSQDGWSWLSPLPQGNSLYNVSYVDAQTIYVSGSLGTLMKSTNSGNSFVVVPTGTREGLSATFINELTGFSSAYNGILRTQNGGFNWQYIPAPVNSVGQVVYVPEPVMFSIKDNILFRSTNLGETWLESLVPELNVTITAFHFANSLTGYTVGKRLSPFGSKIYRTTNGGFNWDSVSSNVRTSYTSVYFVNSITGYVATQSFIYKILKTTNACQSWDTVSSISNNPGILKFFNEMEGYYSLGYTIQTTTNAGQNWLTTNTNRLTFLNNINDGIGLGESGRNFIFKTSNSGLNWLRITQGYSDSFYDVTFLNPNTGFAVAYNKILKTTDGGLNWTEYLLNLTSQPYVENIMFVNDNTGYAGIDNGRIAKTTNCGVNWIIYQTGNSDHNHGMSFPSADTGFIVTKYGFHLKTINGGLNWSVSGQFGNKSYGDVCFADNLRGFEVGDKYSGNPSIGAINVTTNGGASWDSLEIDSVGFLYDACVASTNNWFAAGSHDFPNEGVIVRSTNSGLTWSKTYFAEYVTSIYFPSPLTGYASSSGGVLYKTTNAGDSWFPTECNASDALDGLYFTDNNTGYGVGSGGRIIKTTTGGGNFIGIQPVNSSVPKEFGLLQNYPNPFNPNTKIKFQLVKSDLTRLVIYDVLGREISVLVNEVLKAGNYEVNWNAASYPSGVYFYRLEVENYSETRKMVLIK